MMRNEVKNKFRGNGDETVDGVVDDFLFVQTLKINTVQKLLFLSTVKKLSAF